MTVVKRASARDLPTFHPIPVSRCCNDSVLEGLKDRSMPMLSDETESQGVVKSYDCGLSSQS